MTPSLLGIDASIKGCGLARYIDGRLDAVLVVPSISLVNAVADLQAAIALFCPRGAHAVIELPRIYPAAKQTTDPNDLISIAAVAGACAAYTRGRGGTAEFVAPSTWKGQVPKGVMRGRILDALDERESAIALSAEARDGRILGHNGIDAVGIGLYGLGRIRR